METPAQSAYCFGPFVLDPTEKVLLHDGHPVALPLKAINTLLVLVENHGHVTEKDELLKRVWTDTFVEEATLAQNIFTLRRVLSDSTNTPQYIETVPKRGYRFIAPVNMTGPAQEVHGKVGAALAHAPVPRGLLWAIVAILVMSAGFGMYLRGRPRKPGPPSRAGMFMLAVLPFENFSGDPKQEYFSDGLTEEMISQLSRVNPERLRVIARTSAMQYKGTSKSAAQIGRELGVDYILESSFRREDNRVRITAQLVRVSDQTHLWSQNYERDVRGILPLESEVAGAIAREIEIQLSPQERVRLAGAHPVDPEAHQLYLQGLYFWNKRNTESLHRAVEYFHRAIEKDPNFALAYSGLADSYSLIEYFPDISPAERAARAKAAAQKALELDDMLAETHTSMAMTTADRWDRTPAETEAHFRRAIELNPNYATAHHWYSLFLKDTGRTDEAIVEIERARELDPLSLVINADVGLVYYFARRYDITIQACQKTLEVDPNFRLARWELGMAYEEKRMYPEAVGEYEIAVRLAPDFPPMSMYLARAYALSGRREQALKILRELEKLPLQAGKPIRDIALIHDALGNKDRAFVWLEKSYELGDGYLAWSLKLDPRFDNLRSDPRFRDLLDRVTQSTH